MIQGYVGLYGVCSIMQNHMEKNMEHNTETRVV